MLGVLGAGTMGAGIAQVSCLAGYETYLHDPFSEALEHGIENIQAGLRKGAERGRWSAADAEAAGARLVGAGTLEELAPCEVVIEAAPERLELKRELFAKLSEICGPDAVLATNTSSIPVTALGSAAAEPGRVVGMHFFNPAPLMQLLEVVAGEDSSPEAVEIARSVGERMGKRVISAADGPGFLANRCARPFGLEALRVLADRLADHETIDRIVRMGLGLRMGPFELSDLVGVDVGFEVSKSFYEQSFHEPRWRPSLVQARMVQAGRFGRKAGRGYYDYRSGSTGYRPDDPDPPAIGGGEGLVAVAGDGQLAEDLRRLVSAAGYEPVEAELDGDSGVGLIIDARIERSLLESEFVEDDAAVAVLCVDGSLAQLDLSGGAVGFHALAPLERTRIIELTRNADTSGVAAQRVEGFFRSCGKHVEWVGDAPGLVIGRIACQLVNEACFALAEGVGSAEDIDTALRLGFNHPVGPLERADGIGLDQVLATLDALYDELHEERYRAAPLLRAMVAEGRLGRSVGAGFFTYDE